MTETSVSASSSPYQLKPDQTLRAANALLKKMQSENTSRTSPSGVKDLLDDADDRAEEPVWLCFTTKKYISDERRFKPGKIRLPHPLITIPSTSPSSPSTDTDSIPSTRICLITADPQRKYKDLISSPSFPSGLRPFVSRVLGITKLKARYKSYELRRQLLAEYDIFLADDRIVTLLPKILGKVFYHSGAKRPIPINLQGKKHSKDAAGEKRKTLAQGGTKAERDEVKPESIAREIETALSSALIMINPGTNTSVKVGMTGMKVENVVENINVVVNGVVEKHIPNGWRNIKGLYIKGPKTVALPIWVADELWEKEGDVLEKEPEKVTGKKRPGLKSLALKGAGLKRGAEVLEEEEETAPVAKKSRKSLESESGNTDKEEKVGKKARKDDLKRRKEEAKKALTEPLS